jgi:hypothetical protein
VSKPIWDEGSVLACLCVQTCARCNARGRCLQLWHRTDERGNHQIDLNLCMDCFWELAYQFAKAYGEMPRGPG